MEARMTVCNMSIEAGARAGMIAPDDKTFQYLRGREFAPSDWDAAVKRWQRLVSDPGAAYDRTTVLAGSEVMPQVTWGTNPGQVVSITDRVPRASDATDESQRKSIQGALTYMGLQGGEPVTSLALDRVFIGSCTNSRIEDLRAAAAVVRGYRVADRVHAMVVPGSGRVKHEAEAEGL